MGTILSDEIAIRFNFKFVSVSVLHIQWMQPRRNCIEFLH